jgi:hypothetical protein
MVVFGVLGTTVDTSVITISSLTDLSSFFIIGIESSMLILTFNSLGSLGLGLLLVSLSVSLSVSVSVFAGYCY